MKLKEEVNLKQNDNEKKEEKAFLLFFVIICRPQRKWNGMVLAVIKNIGIISII